MLSEDRRVFGFRGLSSKAEWLRTEYAEQLLNAVRDDNGSDEVSRNFRHKVLDDFDVAVINDTTMLSVLLQMITGLNKRVMSLFIPHTRHLSVDLFLPRTS